MRKAPAISSPSHSRDCPGGSPKSPGRGTDSRLQLLPAMRGKGIGRTVSEAYWAEDRHTPRASDSERVCRGSKDDREAGGVPYWERLLRSIVLPT